MAEQRDIKYINREFSDFRSQLIEFAKNYFPDSYNDFSSTSPGMMFMEMASYVGDVLSFYQDTQIQETFLQYAKDPSNLYTLAYMMGYTPKVTSVSEVELTVFQKVAALAPDYLPNWDQAVKISSETTVAANIPGNPTFLLKNSIDFSFSSSYDPTEVVIDSMNETYGVPAEYSLKKKVKAYSGDIKTYNYTVGSAQKFLTLEIADSNIIGILDIRDGDSNLWYEVPYLGQDTIFEEEDNSAPDNNLVPSILKVTKVPRRFVTRFTSKGVLQIQFGAGIVGQDDNTFIPDPTKFEIGNRDVVNKLDYSYDPSNFLFTRSYGLAPSNTTLTIRYLVGGGVEANAPSFTITNPVNLVASAIDSTYLPTIAFTNESPAEGGRDGDTPEEIRQNSLRSFSEQKRAVTSQDYIIRALSVPPKFGSIAKAYVTNDYSFNTLSVLDRNPLALSLYILAYDNSKKLTYASSTLKDNLKKYLAQYMMLTDAVDIKDAFIVNIGVKFEIIILPNYSARDVLLACNQKLQEYFDISNMALNQPINLANVYTLLDKVKGVQTVKNIIIENKVGGNYSQYSYDIKGATKDNIVYPSYDPCIFEVRYPEIDIEGRITTL